MVELYGHQEQMVKPIGESKNVLLLAPCGSGKTLAVINSWLLSRPTSHLIYVLPTQTLLKSIFKDIQDLINDKNKFTPQFNQEGIKIVKFGKEGFLSKDITIAVDYGEERETRLYSHTIILTTFDSYLARLYRSSLTPRRYRDLPIGRILNSTTVFDEAHMYDQYTHTLMRYTLELLRETKSQHIVMTATLNENSLNFLKLNTPNYEKIYVSDNEWMSFVGNKTIHPLYSFLSKKESITKIIEIIDANPQKRILIVVNTIPYAQSLYSVLLEKRKKTMLLHAKFKSEDRSRIENEIRDFIRYENSVLISTQVIEAGLDISTDLLISQLAPGDSLIQRIGRCGRRKGSQGDIHIFHIVNEFMPYKEQELTDVTKILEKNKQSKSYNIEIEKELRNTVISPDLSGLKESKARSIILSAFDSLSAFGSSLIDLPSRDSTPVYLYLGENKLTDLKSFAEAKPDLVRVDLRYVFGLLKRSNLEFKDVKRYETFYDKDNFKFSEIKSTREWCIIQSSKLNLDYRNDMGILQKEAS